MLMFVAVPDWAMDATNERTVEALASVDVQTIAASNGIGAYNNDTRFQTDENEANQKGAVHGVSAVDGGQKKGETGHDIEEGEMIEPSRSLTGTCHIALSVAVFLIVNVSLQFAECYLLPYSLPAWLRACVSGHHLGVLVRS